VSVERRTAIVTGASEGIGAAVANLFIAQGYNVVGNARHITARNQLHRSEFLALVDGDIGLEATARSVVATAIGRFGSIDVLVNNAGIFFARPFTQYTTEDFRRLSATNLQGFFFTTQLVVRQMLQQRSAGSVTSISASQVDHPLVSTTGSIPMITKGGINAASRSLAMEYAKQGIRFNVVAPGVVQTPLNRGTPQDVMQSLSPLASIVQAADIAAAVLYLAQAKQITGQTLHVDGGSHVGRW
jgi:NAD(P)-dependent dehydrogenase (short-subunit alcohol dehydrogenase family)